MRHSFTVDVRLFPGVMALAVFLFLVAGCAPKAVAPPEIQPPAPTPPPPSVSDIIMEQYEKWKGVSYRFGGTSRAGVDCSGLMLVVFRDAFEIDLPRTSIEQSRVGRSVPREAIRPGDLLFFSDRKTDHIGVAVDGNRFLQASTSVGVTISGLDTYWGVRLSRVSRVLDDTRYAAVARLCGNPLISACLEAARIAPATCPRSL
jgi:hypothetical protein